ncbi:LRP2 [Mytilus edulis]|uniref:LRP2 n=1 Tax=Mytilus edulis TaxID=6550 RepID=A0A8S3RFZ7_MYTED|nr:LRP2 [Mytilus edulis]
MASTSAIFVGVLVAHLIQLSYCGKCRYRWYNPDECVCINYGEEFNCLDDLECVNQRYFCDGYKHCNDGSDEDPEYCKALFCPREMQKCADGIRCIYAIEFCDGKQDCLDGSDENAFLCDETNFKCKKDEFRCKDWTINSYSRTGYFKLCVSMSHVCDGTKNCYDNSDEELEVCQVKTCPEGQVKCADSFRCIPLWALCTFDRHRTRTCSYGPNMSLRSKLCPEYNCGLGHTKCKDNLQCVAERLFCDSLPFKRKRKWFYDCIDKSDEDLDFCKEKACAKGYVRCKDGKQCIPPYAICDGKVHCRDGSDEVKDMCLEYTCTDGRKKCADDIQCISQNLFCNGKTNCIDHSDEGEICIGI